MKKNKSFLRKVIAVILSVVMVVPVNILAAQPETVDPMASVIFKNNEAEIVAQGSGNIRITFTAKSNVGIMTKLGVSGITLYESSDEIDWLPVKTYYSSNISSMMGSNCLTYPSYVSYSGTAGYYYQAHVTFYASNSSGTHTQLFWTPVVRAT